MRPEEAAHAEYMILYIDRLRQFFVLSPLRFYVSDDKSSHEAGLKAVAPSYGDLIFVGFWLS